MFKRLLRSRDQKSGAPLFSILVVSDDPTTNLAVWQTLNDHGYRVHAASDIASAMETLKHIEAPHLLIGDFSHPEVDGVDFLKFARARLGKSTLPPILFLVDSKADENAARAVGAQELLSKPIDQESLVNCVDKLIASRPVALAR